MLLPFVTPVEGLTHDAFARYFIYDVNKLCRQKYPVKEFSLFVSSSSRKRGTVWQFRLCYFGNAYAALHLLISIFQLKCC